MSPLVWEHRGDEEAEWGRGAAGVAPPSEAPGRTPLDQRAAASHSFYFHIIILKQYLPSYHVAFPFLYCSKYRFLHRIEVGNVQECFSGSETKGFSQKSREFGSWGCSMFQTWPGFAAPVLSKAHQPVCCQAHPPESSFSAGSQLPRQCNGFQSSALNPEKWHHKWFLSSHSAFYYLGMWFMLLFLFTFSCIFFGMIDLAAILVKYNGNMIFEVIKKLCTVRSQKQEARKKKSSITISF